MNFQKSYVYLIEDIDNGTYKIGRTKHDPIKRLKQLQTGNSTKLQLLKSFATFYPCRLETLLHNRYQFCNVDYVNDFKKNSKSEWYYFNEEQINNFEKACEELDNMIEIMKDNPYFAKDLK